MERIDPIQKQQLAKLDAEALDLLVQKQQLQALARLEEGFLLRVKLFGADSEEALRSFEHFINQCNTVGMVCLKEGDPALTMQLLRKAESHTERDGGVGGDGLRLRLRATTFNNLGCLYKRIGKLDTALLYLERALHIEVSAGGADNPASTHLNLCAVLSQLGRHTDALEHAVCALDMLKANISAASTAPSETELGTLAVALHNLAVEQEFLGQRDEALESYKKAAALAETSFGASHPMSVTMKQSLRTATMSVLSRPPLKRPQSAKQGKAAAKAAPQSPYREPVRYKGSHGRAQSRPAERPPSAQSARAASTSGRQRPALPSLPLHEATRDRVSVPRPSTASAPRSVMERQPQLLPADVALRRPRRSSLPAHVRLSSAAPTAAAAAVANFVSSRPPAPVAESLRAAGSHPHSQVLLPSAAASPSRGKALLLGDLLHGAAAGHREHVEYTVVESGPATPPNELDISTSAVEDAHFGGAHAESIDEYYDSFGESEQRQRAQSVAGPQPHTAVSSPGSVTREFDFQASLSDVSSSAAAPAPLQQQQRHQQQQQQQPSRYEPARKSSVVSQERWFAADNGALSDPGPAAANADAEDGTDGADSGDESDAEGRGRRDRTLPHLLRMGSMRAGRRRVSLSELTKVIMQQQSAGFALEQGQKKRAVADIRGVTTRMLDRVRQRLKVKVPGASYGRLYVWGNNEHGQLGLGHNEMNKTMWLPNLVSELSKFIVVTVACGAEHIIALTDHRVLYGWGNNAHGQLGLGHGYDVHAPTTIPMKGASSLACGTEHSFVVDVSGRLYGAGRNDDAQLGLGHRSTPVNRFTAVSTLASVPVGNVSAAERHSLAVSRSGLLYAWGCGADGRLGLGHTDHQLTPAHVAAFEGKPVYMAAAGCDHSLCVTESGDLYAWGSDKLEQLGLGAGIRQLSGQRQLQPRNVKHLRQRTIVEIACGYAHNLAFAGDNSTMYTWGLGTSGQLGLGGVDSTSTPTPVMSMDGTRSVSAGLCHSAAIVNDGEVWTWGWGKDGRLGHGTDEDSHKPRRLGLPEQCFKVACGAEFTVVLTGPPLQQPVGDDQVESARPLHNIGRQVFDSSDPHHGEPQRRQWRPTVSPSMASSASAATHDSLH